MASLKKIAFKTGEKSMVNILRKLDHFVLKITPGILEDFLKISDWHWTRSQAKSSDIFEIFKEFQYEK